jgi:predicted nucleic acid-binding protein
LIVLDASLMLAWLLEESEHAWAEIVYNRLARETLLTPANWPLEIANGMRRALRTGRLKLHELEAMVDKLGLLDISVAPPIGMRQIARLTAYAIDHGLSAYDAGYLGLAAESGAPLATFDKAMRSAAKRARIRLLPE